jgi:peptide/nickel transport system permease protein
MNLYLVRRIGQAFVVVLGVMFLTFILAHLEPGSAARATLGLKATPARVALFDRVYGLDKPLPVQFVDYILNALHGNLGSSYSLKEPVSTLIAQRLPLDVLLLGTSTVLALLIALPIGIYQALHHNHLIDDVLGGTWFTLYSAPDFMLALLLIALFCVRLRRAE